MGHVTIVAMRSFEPSGDVADVPLHFWDLTTQAALMSRMLFYREKKSYLSSSVIPKYKARNAGHSRLEGTAVCSGVT
jgi:hypothetical protein